MRSIPVLYSDLYLNEYETVDCENSYRVAGVHPAIADISGRSREDFFEQFDNSIKDAADYDIVACSAGFDIYIHDWGGLLLTGDFKTIGARLASCHKHVFSVLEGGYYLQDLGKNVRAYLEGFLEACS